MREYGKIGVVVKSEENLIFLFAVLGTMVFAFLRHAIFLDAGLQHIES
jgi:hypothetical protein